MKLYTLWHRVLPKMIFYYFLSLPHSAVIVTGFSSFISQIDWFLLAVLGFELRASH
jgi:hypothetical protein